MGRRGVIIILTVAAALGFLAAQMRPAPYETPYDLDSFGRIPVSADGRVKPLDSVARNSLIAMSGKQTLRIDGQRVPAIAWLTDVIARPQEADNVPVFLIRHPNLRESIDPQADARRRFTFAELAAQGERLTEQAAVAQQTPDRLRDHYQQAVLELFTHVQRYVGLQRMSFPYAVPPAAPGDQWEQLGVAMERVHVEGVSDPAAAALAGILRAYHDRDAPAFNQRVHEYLAMVGDMLPVESDKAGFEVFFNRFAPFYQGIVLYVVVFLLALASLLVSGSASARGDDQPANPWSARLWLIAVTLIAVTFALHTFGLTARIVLQGRPPVTNLYSSAVFIGWVVVLLTLFLEWLYRNGLGVLLGAVIGFVTLVIAHNLAAGDTMQMMQAVLDSNFWLSTHVVAITIGYSATFLAGAIGIAYILTGVYTRALTGERVKSLGKMMYGVIAFALLFSFVGTVLGGIWADQSWGRFWGWDPKENGAVLIVLMNALILHARFGGMVQQRGTAVLAVGGNVVTAWSWFGTNMLGVGLHSYGFMGSAYFWLLAFVASQLAIMSVGMLPQRYWASFAARGTKPQRESTRPVPETAAPKPLH